MKTKKLKLRAFIEQRAKDGEALEPTAVMETYNERTGKNIKLPSVSEMLINMGYTKEKREALTLEKSKANAARDIFDFQEWSNYKRLAEDGRVQQKQVEHVGRYIRQIWEWMNKTDPHTWKYTELMIKIEEHYPKFLNEKNQRVYRQPSAVMKHLGALNTVFKGIIPENFSAGLSRPAGELKDYFRFDEFNLFIENCQATPQMSQKGWRALYKCQVNGALREGTNGINGVLGLLWEKIDFNTKRCSAFEKGGRGNASREWKNIPLDLFPWIQGWASLIDYWSELGMPHTGKVFTVTYDEYLDYFHKTRKLCNGRISGEKETFRPHIFRKTHAQWGRKLRIPLEILAGHFPDGSFGVGWDNITIIMKYYADIEPDEYEEAQKKADDRMKALGLV
jgi:integrase